MNTKASGKEITRHHRQWVAQGGPLLITQIILCGLIISSVLAIPPTVVDAHGGGTPRLVNEQAGPYFVSVWTQPEPLRAGEVHMSIAVMLPDDTVPESTGTGTAAQQMVTDADVRVTFEAMSLHSDVAENSVATEIVSAVALPQSAPIDLYYEADLELSREGQWRAIMEINGERGSGTVAFEETVLPPRQLNWSLIAILVLLFSGILAVVGAQARRRSEPPKRKRSYGRRTEIAR